MSPNLPAEFFAKPPLPFGGKGAKIKFCRCLCQPQSIFLSHSCDNAVVCHGSNYLLLVQHQICLFRLPEIEVRVRGCTHTVLQMFRNYGTSFCFCMCRDVNPYCLHWHYYMSVAWFWRITCIAFQEAYENGFFYVPVKLWLCLFTKGVFCTMIGVHDWMLRIWKNFPVRSHEVSVLDFLSGIFLSKNLTVTIMKLIQHLQITL